MEYEEQVEGLPRMRGDDPGPPAYDAIMLVFAPHARG